MISFIFSDWSFHFLVDTILYKVSEREERKKKTSWKKGILSEKNNNAYLKKFSKKMKKKNRLLKFFKIPSTTFKPQPPNFCLNCKDWSQCPMSTNLLFWTRFKENHFVQNYSIRIWKVFFAADSGRWFSIGVFYRCCKSLFVIKKSGARPFCHLVVFSTYE